MPRGDEERLSLSADELAQLQADVKERLARGVPPPILLTGADLIAAERRRQVAEEGWTPEHDDGHERGELVDAAICYARLALGADPVILEGTRWPWGGGFKPGTDERNLARAGALIAAEIDRLQRAAALVEEGRWRCVVAPDVLRELAAEHPELLTRDCECKGEHARYDGRTPYGRHDPVYVPACIACDSTGRRLLTLEETINELQRRGHIPIMFWGDEAHGSTVECCPDETCCAAHRAEGTYHREAAYRLLIEVSRG